MKIIIQNRKTKLYYKNAGGWTEDVEKARCFDGALAAFNFAEMNSLGDTEVVFTKESHVRLNREPGDSIYLSA